MNKSSGATTRWGTGATEEEGGGGVGAGRGVGREYEVEDIIGRRKHALAVEIPRTVLFRLVGFYSLRLRDARFLVFVFRSFGQDGPFSHIKCFIALGYCFSYNPAWCRHYFSGVAANQFTGFPLPMFIPTSSWPSSTLP